MELNEALDKLNAAGFICEEYDDLSRTAELKIEYAKLFNLSKELEAAGIGVKKLRFKDGNVYELITAANISIFYSVDRKIFIVYPPRWDNLDVRNFKEDSVDKLIAFLKKL